MWIPNEAPGARSLRGGLRGGHRGGGPVGRGRFPGPFDRHNWARTPRTRTTNIPSQEPPLGPLLYSLSKSDFDQDAKTYESRSVITDCKTVSSYSWLDSIDATILVPGKPPRWTPLAKPRQLKPDSDVYFRDRNSANFPKHPIEPAIVAALTIDPDVAREIDIVACSSTLGNLLRFIRAEDKQFRMLVECVGSTVFFVRRENTPREIIPDVKGYGHSFPEAYTSWDPEVKGATSHQRVLSYRFGGLSCLVRFESDGYIVGKDDEKPSEARDRTIPADIGDDLSAALAGNRVTSTAPAKHNGDLKVVRAGHLVKQDHIFELKTRSYRRKEAGTFEDTFGDQLPRLWVAQLPKFILAYHNDGIFADEDITIRDVEGEVRAWERDHVDALSHLAALIHRIIALVRARPDCKLELRHDTIGILEVREQRADAGDALSTRVRALWAESEESTHATSLSEDSDSDSSDSAGNGWDGDDFEPDFTACSADSCGYCGRCSY